MTSPSCGVPSPARAAPREDDEPATAAGGDGTEDGDIVAVAARVFWRGALSTLSPARNCCGSSGCPPFRAAITDFGVPALVATSVTAPDVEVIAADTINDADDSVLASDVRYRFAIDTATLG